MEQGSLMPGWPGHVLGPLLWSWQEAAHLTALVLSRMGRASPTQHPAEGTPTPQAEFPMGVGVRMLSLGS